jgi:hypothetical protein
VQKYDSQTQCWTDKCLAPKQTNHNHLSPWIMLPKISISKWLESSHTWSILH